MAFTRRISSKANHSVQRIKGGRTFITTFLFAILCIVQSSSEGTSGRDVKSLESESDFNQVELEWQYELLDEDLFEGFKITYCEDQAWGPHRCRSIVRKSEELRHTDLPDGSVKYSAQVPHLRMATNYTVRVQPTTLSSETIGRSPDAKARAISAVGHSAQIFVQTKGFSARAISCLTNSTLVEAETGPFFGGKISVEGSTHESCSVHGETKDSRSTYRLNIDHKLCNSEIVNNTVRNYILVQENLPILTHSTRRFLVVCRYIPQAFTVSAGVSLPADDESPVITVDSAENEVDPSELFDSTNILLNSRRGSRTGKALKFSSQGKSDTEEDAPPVWSQLLLTLVMVVGGVVGLACAFWHYGKHAGIVAAIRKGLVHHPTTPDTISPGDLHTTVIVSGDPVSLSELDLQEPPSLPVELEGDDDQAPSVVSDSEPVSGEEAAGSSDSEGGSSSPPSNWETFDDYDSDVITV